MTPSNSLDNLPNLDNAPLSRAGSNPAPATTTKRRKVSKKSAIPIIVSYGGGINSSAMLIEMRDRAIKPALILFADTGGERPETYELLENISRRCFDWFGVDLKIVRKLFANKFEGLEGDCLRLKNLPALAYGRRNCSAKYKLEPQFRESARWMKANRISHVVRAIGFDTSENYRARISPQSWATNWYPLIEWKMSRDDCKKKCEAEGFDSIAKSSCFFCPAMKRGEILELQRTHPELLERALRIESNSVTRTRRGLGGKGMFWRDVIDSNEKQAKLWTWIDQHEPTRIPCGCID